VSENERILLAHGGGGRLSEELLRNVILPRLGNSVLARLTDAAELMIGGTRIAMSTDSFTVDPIFFPGGDIGSLAVHGTINDVAMVGADPVCLSCGFIIAEGFPMAALERIVDSMAKSATAAGVQIVTGDTKVVGRASMDGIFINTTGLGVISPEVRLGANRVSAGDKVIISGTLADHGVTILCQRQGLAFDIPVVSDSAPLHRLAAALRVLGPSLKFMRDPTRGGLAATLNELVRNAPWGIRIDEQSIPMAPAVAAALEIIGLDPLHVANEGKLVAVVAAGSEERALTLLRSSPLGANARLIGEITNEHQGLVVMKTNIGGARIIDNPAGELLPRIC